MAAGLGWRVGAYAVAAAVIAPLASVLWLAFNPAENIWPHLAATVLPAYVVTTFLLMLGVGVASIVIGVGTAWLVTMCRFPGRRIFEWGLLLPMAIPAYVVAYVYTDLLEFAGPVQRGLRGLFGWQSPRDYWFPEIRSLGGAIAVMSLVLYPYVYMLARAAFLVQSVGVLEAGRSLGRGPWRSFMTLAVPLARPAIVVGTTLVLMETLNDFGTVDFFAVRTLTAGIFHVWLHMNNVGGAAQIAAVMLIVVLALIAIERAARRGRKFHDLRGSYRPLPAFRLAPGRRLLAVLACATPIGLGFVVPALVLLRHTLGAVGETSAADVLLPARNSLMLSSLAALVALAAGLLLAYGLRLAGGAPGLKLATRLASLGYAVPGAVLALGVLIPFAAFDNALDAAMRATFGISTGLVLSGTVVAVVFAYVARFLAVSFGALEASLEKVTPTMDMAARSLGQGLGGTLRRVHLPLMRGGLFTAAILVFVDCMKELPATLILRPFNFDTLATQVYQYASDELIRQAAPSALAIVAAGVVPVVLLSRAIAHSRPGHGTPSPTATY